jgi:hypothetical protein
MKIISIITPVLEIKMVLVLEMLKEFKPGRPPVA